MPHYYAFLSQSTPLGQEDGTVFYRVERKMDARKLRQGLARGLFPKMRGPRLGALIMRNTISILGLL